MAASRKGSAAKPAPADASIPQGWTEAEFTILRGQLLAHNDELRAAIAAVVHDIHDLAAEANSAAGDDVADTGSRAFLRDQDLQVAGNARELLDQNERALARMADGTYGICESCGQPIAKGRLQAHPGATLCVSCKAKQERR